MPARSSTERTGLTAFRLSDIPISVRRAAGSALAREASEDALLAERVFLERAIEYPSDRLYWIPTAVYERERQRRKAWRG
jgi:hypothetical protein